MPSIPDPQTKLWASRGRDCSRAIVQTWPERLGSWISGIALVMLLCVGLGPGLLRKTPRR